MKQHIPSLDGLRALAIILVMLFHFKLLDCGWIGVQMFFVLSGFLITKILLDEKSETLSFFLKRFYWRRSLRIFPIYFTYLFLITVVFFIIGKPESLVDKWGYLYSYTFNFSRLFLSWTPDYFFTHLWSLSVEEQFYLLWPLLIYFLSKRDLKILIIFLVIACPAYRIWLTSVLSNMTLNPEWIGEGVYWNTISHLDAFALGGALSVFKFEKKIYTSPLPLLITFLLVLCVGIANYYVLNKSENGISISSLGFPVGGIRNYQPIWSYTILDCCFAALILYLTKNTSNVLSNKYLISIGKVSYGMYIFHWSILWIFLKLIPEKGVFLNSIFFILYFLIIYGLAYLSYQFFEIRFLIYKDKFFTARKHAYNPI